MRWREERVYFTFWFVNEVLQQPWNSGRWKIFNYKFFWLLIFSINVLFSYDKCIYYPRATLAVKKQPPQKNTYLALNCFETSCCSKRVLPFHLNYPLESCNSANYFNCNEAAVGLVVIVSKIIQHCCKVSSNPAFSIWNTHFLSKLPFLVVVQGS